MGMALDRESAARRMDMSVVSDVAGFQHDRFGTQIQAKAVRLHQMNRERAMHFNAPVMADSAMDVMLTLVIGQEQNTPLSLMTLALANRLNAQDCASLITQLAEAGLVVTHKQDAAGSQMVALTDRGFARMRGYIMDQRVA